MAIINLAGVTPQIITKPSVVFNWDESHASGADGVQINCAIQAADTDVDPETADVDTACDPTGVIYTVKSETVELTLRWSEEMWAALKPFEMSEVTMVWLANWGLPVSVTNRERYGVVRFGQLPDNVFYARSANQTITLSLPVVGGELSMRETAATARFTHPDGPVTGN